MARKLPGGAQRAWRLVTVTERTCPRCGEVKPAAGFYRSKVTRVGLSTYCKPCSNKMQRNSPIMRALADARRHGLEARQRRLSYPGFGRGLANG